MHKSNSFRLQHAFHGRIMRPKPADKSIRLLLKHDQPRVVLRASTTVKDEA